MEAAKDGTYSSPQDSSNSNDKVDDHPPIQTRHISALSGQEKLLRERSQTLDGI